MTNIIFNEYKLNSALTLKNRIVMAPMTRAKASDDLLATDDMAAYYARRANAGLIVTEGTVIAADASGFKNVPGIFSDAQIAHWKNVTDQVHREGGKIFLQLWHVGRASHPSFLNGNLPISASETIMSGRISRSPGLTYGKSRAATLAEIKTIISQYAIGAENAIKAGFDGVEIHGANGYLIDQFLHYHTNKRSDEYGSTPENMARFALEVLNACVTAIGAERVGLRLSPGGYLNEIVGDARDAFVFQYLLQALNKLPIAYVHTGNFNDATLFPELGNMTMTEFMRQYYQGTLIASGSYSYEKASEAIAQNQFDLITFGRPFIANPDLVHKLQTQQSLIAYDAAMLNTLY